MISEDILRASAFAKNSAACLVLVHPEIQMLEKALVVIEHTQIPIVQIGKELSEILLDTQRAEQSRTIARWFEARFSSSNGKPLACSQIDLLFEPCFQLDPLALFKKASRNNGLIVLWPGDFTNQTLSYAVPEHRHFRTWRIDDPILNIVRLQN
jgi:hypothetical protein